MHSIIVPIVKDNKGILTDQNNYRPIALTCISSKILELILMTKYGHFLNTGDAQFGFKTGHATDLCIFTLKETVQHYVSLGSPVYLCFMDLSKAFDKVNHWILFQKLLARGCPLFMVRLLVHWYSHQECVVKWGNTLSAPFTVTNGVRQGSVLSPYLIS